jgi:hypothetical protein
MFKSIWKRLVACHASNHILLLESRSNAMCGPCLRKKLELLILYSTKPIFGGRRRGTSENNREAHFQLL